MSVGASSFLDKLKSALHSDRVVKAPTFKVGGRVLEILKNLLESIDLSTMTKAEFLAAVDAACDSVIQPLFASLPWLYPLVNAMVLSFAGQFYDNHSKPKS
jgi:hypothetical protein